MCPSCGLVGGITSTNAVATPMLDRMVAKLTVMSSQSPPRKLNVSDGNCTRSLLDCGSFTYTRRPANSLKSSEAERKCSSSFTTVARESLYLESTDREYPRI